jgi:uncharacterized protein YbjT (DUF2867 family)
VTRVLVTGGTGGLGSEVVQRLVKKDHAVRISSRKPAPANAGLMTEWAQVSLESGEGLAEAVAGMDCVAHCASSPFRKTAEIDVAGTRRLLEACKTAGVGHFLYISIVGIDKVPNPYYKHKLAAEQAIEAAGVPYTILRATQFHTLIDRFFSDALLRFPIGFVPGAFKFQTIDTGEVADRMVELIEAGPSGRADDIGGPEVLSAAHMARTWAKAARKRKLILPMPAFGKIAAGFKAALNCCPDNKYGKITWQQYLDAKFGSRN